MILKKIEEKTAQILSELGINELPIPIKKVADFIGVQIHSYDLGENISGVLVIKNDQGIIGVNPTESSVRQRFTIAHELGHYVLHKNSNESIFVDKDFGVLFRKRDSSTGEYKREQEANSFAASILMPKEMLEKQIKQHYIDLTDEVALKGLAKKFDVSLIAMTIRISNLF